MRGKSGRAEYFQAKDCSFVEGRSVYLDRMLHPVYIAEGDDTDANGWHLEIIAKKRRICSRPVVLGHGGDCIELRGGKRATLSGSIHVPVERVVD